MASFVDNLRSIQPSLNVNPPLGNILQNRVIQRPNQSVPSDSDIGQWENWRIQQNLTQKNDIERPAWRRARNGTLFIEKEEANPADAGTMWASKYQVADKSIFDNYDALESMIGEYEKTETYDNGEKVIKTYYDKIENKSPVLNQMLNMFAEENKKLKDYEEYSGVHTDPKELGNFMRNTILPSKAKYGGQKY